MIPIIIGRLGIFSKNLEKRLEELEIRRRIETIQSPTLMKLAKMIRKILETWEDLLSLWL